MFEILRKNHRGKTCHPAKMPIQTSTGRGISTAHDSGLMWMRPGAAPDAAVMLGGICGRSRPLIIESSPLQTSFKLL